MRDFIIYLVKEHFIIYLTGCVLAYMLLMESFIMEFGREDWEGKLIVCCVLISIFSWVALLPTVISMLIFSDKLAKKIKP